MSSTTFQHVPLESPKEEIRLVQILPGTDDICLTLHRHEFIPDLEYVALSYEWGTIENPEKIHLNGRVLSIRQNLHSALQSLRTLQADRTEDRLFHREAPKFWIDAICINQIDDNEKNHQVAMMGRIYRQAAQTIAWLGQNGGISSVAFHSMNRRTLSNSEQGAIKAVCECSYFQRMWIVQEVVLSKNLHFVCGLTRCPWDTFVQFWDGRKDGSWNGDYRNGVNRLSMELVEAKSRHDRTCPVSLFEYIRTAGENRRCTDVRDTVYAFLGLLERDSRAEEFEVDYQVSLEGLLVRLEAYSSQNPNESGQLHYHRLIPLVFEKHLTKESRDRVVWYWIIMEMLHCLSGNVVGQFSDLTAVRSAGDLEILLQFICWTIAGCGIDLFSFLADEEAGPQITQDVVDQSTIETIWNRELGQCSYKLGIEKPPLTGLDIFPGPEWDQTALDALKCRELLLTFNENVRELIMASEHLVKIREKEQSTVEPGIQTNIPTAIERTVFANLLARFFLEKFWDFGESARDKDIRGFIDDQAGDADLLPMSFSERYRMTIIETQNGKESQLPHNTLVTLPLEVTNISCGWQHGSPSKSLTACLFRNNDWCKGPSTKGSRASKI